MKKPKVKAVLALAAYWILTTITLFFVYPLGESYLPDTSRAGMLGLYFEMVIIIGCCGTAIVVICRSAFHDRRLLRSAVAFVAGTVLLAAYGMLVGDSSADTKANLPLAGMHSIFLGELGDVKFVWVVSPLCGLLLAATCLLSSHDAGRRQG